ncbi:symplekin isoform X1 [Tanacetum coccineum]
MLKERIKILEARIEMKRHPEDHPCESDAMLHELLDEIENLHKDHTPLNDTGNAHSTTPGLYSSELDDSLESSWAWVLKLKDEIYTMAYQPESDGRKLLALKFVESVTLLYTTDPSASSEPPTDQTPSEWKRLLDEWNIERDDLE